MQFSPLPRRVDVPHIAANYAELSWYDVSAGTYLYDIQYRIVGSTSWSNTISTSGSSYYVDGLTALTSYQFRIRTRIPAINFLPSDWVLSEEFTTFETNSFSLVADTNVSVNSAFFQNKLVDNDISYVDFNEDDIRATLMNDRFVFNENINSVQNVQNNFVVSDTRQRILGKIPFLIDDRRDVSVGSYFNLIYVFHSDTSQAFYTRNNGVSWVRFIPYENKEIGYTNDNHSFKSSEIRPALVMQDSVAYGELDEVYWDSLEVYLNDENYDFASSGPTGLNVDSDGVVKFLNEVTFPTGITSIQCMEITNEYLVISAGGGTLYFHQFNNPYYSGNNIKFRINSAQIAPGVENLYVKNIWSLNGEFYVLVTGETNENGELVSSEHAGVYRYTPAVPQVSAIEKVIGDEDSINPYRSSLSTDGERLILGMGLGDQTESALSNNKPYRKVYTTTDGDTWTYQTERFSLESFYGYFRNDGFRLYSDNKANVTSIAPSQEYTIQLENASESFTQFGDYNFYTGGTLQFNDFPGYTKGVLFWDATSGRIIGYYEFEYRERINSTLVLENNLLFNARLSSISRGTEIIDIEGIPVRTMPETLPIGYMVEKIAPEHYIDGDNKLFGDFIRLYLDSISEKDMPVGVLQNMLFNHDVNRTEFMDLFTTDLARRNVVDSGQRRLDVQTFLSNRKFDFLKAKGIEESYKWMFRALYDSDVEIFIENKLNYETFMVIESSADIENIAPGITIEGPNGSASINYVERAYLNGEPVWRIIVQSVRGSFLVGDAIENFQSDQFDPVILTGTVVDGVDVRDINPDPRFIKGRGRAFYTIRVTSQMPMSKWKNDVIRFVHPVGFNFIGILLLTVLVNTGLSLAHMETITRELLSFRWDRGLPLEVWGETAILDSNGDYQYTSSDIFPLTTNNPRAGNTVSTDSDYQNDGPDEYAGLTREQRRRNTSPTFDSTVNRFVEFLRID